MHSTKQGNNKTGDGVTTRHARVVVIGGGIMGCGVAYHLAEAGCTDVVLLEKGELTSGSTWHAAGQITYCTAHYTLSKCVAYNMALYQRLEKETGQSVTWHGCGSLRMAYTEDECDWLRQIISVGSGLDLPMEIVDAKGVHRLHPYYHLDGIKEALWTAADGHVDPAGVTFALAKGARQRGVDIIRRCRATDVQQLPSGEWRVRGERGDIICEHVVNAGGTYARQMALWNGYDLPTTSMTHHYFVTEKVPAFESLDKELPVVRDDRMVSGYIRMEQKSALIGIYEKADPRAVWLDGTPWESENELFEPNYERVMPWLENALQRVPLLAELGIKRAVHGAISHPPDGNPLIGPAPGLRNYWCCCGCQIGIGWGPALTRELARWILHGAADLSMRDFDPRRFGDYADAAYQQTKAKEDYLLRHETPFPHYNRLAARPQKPGALYSVSRDKGAVFEEVYGWERPRWFAPAGVEAADQYAFRRNAVHDIVAAEVQAVRRGVGIMDISAFAKIIVSGEDAAAFIGRLIPNRPPVVGRITLSHLLTAGGRIELETTVVRLAEDRFYLVCAAFFEQRILDYLAQQRQPEERLSVINQSQHWGALALNGPKSRAVLSACTETAVDNDSFPWLRVREIVIGDKRLWALRLSYAGELGWELHGETTAIVAAERALSAAGQAHGVKHYGSFAMNAMRLEKAYKGAGELTNEVTLPEADVMRFVDMEKEFVGKAATVRALKNPLRWRCVYLEFADAPASDADGNGGETVFADGKAVGIISSIAYGHTVGKLLAFAYVAPAFAEPSTTLDVMLLGETRTAVVRAEAAYDAANRRPRATEETTK